MIKVNRFGIFVSLFLLLFTPGVKASGTSASLNPGSQPEALILLDLESEDQLPDLATKVQTYFLRLETSQDRTQYLLKADTVLMETLASSGFSFKVVDPDMRGNDYFHLYGLPETLRQAQIYCEVLLQEGRQAVVRTTPDQVSRLEASGLMIQPLHPQPLVYPSVLDAEILQPPSTPDVITSSPLVQDMVFQVNSNTLYNQVGNLSGEWAVIINGSPYYIFSRFTYSDIPIKKATRFAYEYFQSIGLPVDYHYYTAGGFELRNVIAEQSGLTQPQRIFMIIAHIDDTSEAFYSYAPGADDNASGSSAVMAIANILKNYNFGCTLRYALFTGEEQGYYGSGAYAANAHQLGENIEGVLNLDMVAYNSAGTSPTLELHTRRSNLNDLAIANLFADSVHAYSINLIPIIYRDSMTFSDHASFWNYLYPAILAIEDWGDHTPYYHKTGDQLETLNLPYYSEFTKAALATFAHMGCLLDGKLVGTVRDSVSGNPISGAFVEASSGNGQTHTTTTQGDGSYKLSLLTGNYTVTSSAVDHRTETATGVQVIQYQATTLDQSLQPCLTVKDLDFTFSPDSPAVDETVNFTATVGGGEVPISFSWDFWDGGSALGQYVTHAYSRKGGFAARLTADNACLLPESLLYPIYVEAELLYMPLISH